jgi:hypothetical protein
VVRWLFIALAFLVAAADARAAVYGIDADYRLVALDPLTLQPTGTAVPLRGRDQVAPSPDRTWALAGEGFMGKGDVALIDLAAMRQTAVLKVGKGSNGYAGVAGVGWLDAQHGYVVLAGSGPTAAWPPHLAMLGVIDVATRHVTRTRLPGQPIAVADGAILLRSWHGSGAVTLAVFDADGGVRTRRLARIHATDICCDKVRIPALALDPSGARAYVLGAGEPIAEVSLPGLGLRYRPWPHTRAASARRHAQARGSAYPRIGPELHAGWLGDGRVVICGRDGLDPRAYRAEGLRILDTIAWKARMVDRNATAFALSTGMVFPLGASSLTAFDGGGHRVFHALDGHTIDNLEVIEGILYVEYGSRLLAFDPASGRLLATHPLLDATIPQF